MTRLKDHKVESMLILIFLLIGVAGPACGDRIELQCSSDHRFHKADYLNNGCFQQHYDFWEKSLGDLNKGASHAEIVTFPPGHWNNIGKTLHIRHTGESHIQFVQIVPVPGPDMTFSASFRADSREGMLRAFSGSGVAQIGLQYQDETGKRLGETILVNYVKNPFADTPLIGVPRRSPDTHTTHYIEFRGGQFIEHYAIDIRREIEGNLMGIRSEEVRFIAVVLWCGGNHPQASAELWITGLSLKEQEE